MRVKSVSLVFNLALKKAGTKAQMAPAAMPATASMMMSSQPGTESPMSIMQAATASAPARTWPSAPMFQKRILNAGVTAREMHSSIARFCSSTQVLREVPKAPSNIAA